MIKRIVLVCCLLIAILSIVYWFNRLNSGKPRRVGKTLPPGKLKSIDEIDHLSWDRLLARFVNENGRVAYSDWSNDKQARMDLQAYLEDLSLADPAAPATRQSRLAFWINSYNALTVHGILQEFPTDSIRNHTSSFGGYNIWNDLKLVVGNEEYSLNQIEHQILREMNEPRIHLAIVCASKSCPRLLNQAYDGRKLSEQLNANAVHFFADEKNFRLADNGRVVYLSAILNWFGTDFGENPQEVLQSILSFLPPGKKEEIVSEPVIRYLDYDWSLNGE